MTTKIESPEGEKLTPRHKIHTEPLTQILDEIEDSIRSASRQDKKGAIRANTKHLS
jgi:hypothetical protein